MPQDVGFSSVIEKIGQVVGYAISIYVYGKIVSKVYQYGQELITNYRIRQNHQRIRQAAQGLKVLIESSPYLTINLSACSQLLKFFFIFH